MNSSAVQRRAGAAKSLFAALLAFAASASAHEAGAPFSGAIIDPLVLHHAHIENEQRINLFGLRNVAGSSPRRNGYEAELELGWSNDKFNLGMEAFVPYRSVPSPEGEGRQTGIGDMEIRPIKYAFINRPDFVMSTATGIGLPTGTQSRGLGSGNTSLTQYLFVDKAFGNLYAGFNFALDKRIRGKRGTGTEYGTVIAYSFINGGSASGFADPEPGQSLVVSASLEFIGNKRFSGEDAAERSTSIVPGITFWWPKSGWQIHAGVSIPRSGTREADRTFLLQIGNHFNWEDLFSGTARH